ncbi:MAG TPA: LysR family transcriptional regulator [Polyangiaceae bacterium]|nr:LysR family transcriptional regulator [Polyangiaceae bacterium]
MNDLYGRDLDLNLLRVFAVVAEEGSITRAASRLYVTQPAVSAAMRRLTSFVGTELFVRQGRGVVLTNRGTELLTAARAYLPPLVAATMAVPVFDPKRSAATVPMGLADALEALLLPTILTLLRSEAPEMQVVVMPAQFRTVEELLLSNKVGLAVCVADELPRSILRQPLTSRSQTFGAFVCLYDPRFSKLPKTLSEREYFAREHIAVSYAGDARGIVEDSLGKSRKVRVSVPAFGYVGEVVDGSPLLATVPFLLAAHIMKTRPHLRTVRMPFSIGGANLDLLWSRVTDDDDAMRFVRDLVTRAARRVLGAPSK